MARTLEQVVAHIRAVAADPRISTTLIQTEDLLALCNAAEARTPSPDGVREAVDHLMIKRAQKAAPKFWKDYASAYDHMLHVLTSALSKPAGDE